jgi:hypothetical protein
MILLEVVDAEEREPVPPEVLASLRKARQNALEDQSQSQSQSTPGVDSENPEDISSRQSKPAYRKESRWWRNAKIALVVYFVLFSAIGTLLLAAVRLPCTFPTSLCNTPAEMEETFAKSQSQFVKVQPPSLSPASPAARHSSAVFIQWKGY